MLAVGVGTVRGGIWVKYSNIEKKYVEPWHSNGKVDSQEEAPFSPTSFRDN